MFKALVIFFITVFLLTILLRFLRKVIGFFGGNIYTSRENYNAGTNKNTKQEQASIQKRFSKNEGEYVDYEEIEDDDSSSK